MFIWIFIHLAYNDHPERDSLDGILPSSAVSGRPSIKSKFMLKKLEIVQQEQSAKSKRHLNKEKEAMASGLGGQLDPPLPPRLSGLVSSKSATGGGAISIKSKSIMKSTWTGEREPL